MKSFNTLSHEIKVSEGNGTVYVSPLFGPPNPMIFAPTEISQLREALKLAESRFETDTDLIKGLRKVKGVNNGR